MKFKRILSILLSLAVTSLVIPQAVAEAPPEILQAVRITELNEEEANEGVVYFGSVKGLAEERGQYIYTVYRDGYSDEAASVRLQTVDISAKIGVDYDIIGEATEYTGIDKTIMQRNAGEDIKQVVQEYSDGIKEIQADIEGQEGVTSAAAEEATISAAPTSSLAVLKEQQTGIESRQLYSNSQSSMQFGEMTEEQAETSKMLNEYQNDHAGDYVEYSSETLLAFEAGETEKQILVEVYEDKEPESDEIAMFLLTDPENVRIGDFKSSTLTIEDDEEEEEAYIGFSQTEYTLDGSNREVSLIRTGAEYTIVSADITLGGETQTIMFNPYVMERKVSLDAQGNGIENLTLSNFKGCAGGDILSAPVYYGGEKNAKAEPFETVSGMFSKNSPALFTSEGDLKSFYLEGIEGSNGFKLRVDYVPGQMDQYGYLYGKVMDEGLVPEVQVGVYYFPSAFNYGLYGGSKGTGWWHSDHQVEGTDEYIPEDYRPDGHGRLEFYSPGVHTGYAGCRIENIDQELYAYYGADWSQSRTFGSGQKSRVITGNNGFSSTLRTVDKNGTFDRTTTLISTLDNNLPNKNMGSVTIQAVDDSSSTPKVRVDLNGMLAMYRKFKVDLESPPDMEFINGTQKERQPAVNVGLGVGHDTRWTNQSLQVSTSAANTDGVIKAEQVGYKIITNYSASDSKLRKEFTILGNNVDSSSVYGGTKGTVYRLTAEQSKNMSAVAFDKTLLSYIDANILGIRGGLTDWITDIRIQPLYRYKNIKLQVIESTGGSLKNNGMSNLSVGEHSYHVGDTLYIDPVPLTNYTFTGYRMRGFATNNENEEPVFDVEVKTEYAGNQILGFAGYDCARVTLEPIFKHTRPYYITLKYQGGEEHYNVQNVLTREECDYLREINPNWFPDNWSVVSDHIYAPNILSDEDMKKMSYLEQLTARISVVPGQVYRIQGTSDDPTKMLAYEVYNHKSRSMPSYDFPFAASNVDEYNVIRVWQHAASDYISDGADFEENTDVYQIHGRITMPFYSIRSSSQIDTKLPNQGCTVSYGTSILSYRWVTPVGSGQAQKVRYAYTPTTTTDENGYFTLTFRAPKNITAYDYMPMVISHDGVEDVQYFSMGNWGSKDVSNITIIDCKTNDSEMTNYEEPVTVSSAKRYDLYSTIETSVFSGSAPVPVSLDYSYSNYKNNRSYGTFSNSVAIVDDNFTVNLKINSNGHKIKKAVFTLDKQNGADLNFDATPSKTNPSEFVCRFDGKTMDKNFDKDDVLYVTLYDEEKQEIGMTNVDAYGNSYISYQEKEISYTKLFTGLSFYIPTKDAVPQSLNVNQLNEGINAPIMGNIQTRLGTGVLSFTKDEWTGNVDGYSLVFDISANAHNISTSPGAMVLDGVKGMKNNASQKATEIVESSGGAMGTNPGEKLWQNEYNQTYKKSLANTFSGIKMNINQSVLMRFDFVYVQSQSKYMLQGGQIAIGGAVSVSKTFYSVLNGIPVFLQLSAATGIELQANYAEFDNTDADLFAEQQELFDILPKDTDVGVLLWLNLKLQVGVGICGILSARGIIAGDVMAFVALDDLEEFKDDSGILLKLSGGFGLDLVLFTMQYMWEIGTVGAGRYKDYTGWGDAQPASLMSENIEDGLSDGTVRVYNMGGGNQVGGSGGPVQLMDSELLRYQTLIDNAPERTKPQIITLNDGRKLLVYIGADVSRDVEANQAALYYSVCDTSGIWSMAKQVENDGTPDGTPSLAKYGDDVIIAWADAKEALSTGEASAQVPKEALGKMEISACKFDSASNSMGEIYTLTNDTYMDYAPVICADEKGIDGAAVYYIKRDLHNAETADDLANPNVVYETVAMNYITNDEGVLHKVDKFIPIKSDPLMINFDAAVEKIKIGGEEHIFTVCSYIDCKNDLQNSDKWDTYLLLYDLTADKAYDPVNLCNDYDPDMVPKLTNIDGRLVLTYLTQQSAGDSIATEFKSMSVTGMIERLSEKTDFNNVLANSGDGRPWYRKTAEELGLSGEEYEGSIYQEMYNLEFPVSSHTMKLGDQMSISPTVYDIIKGGDGNVYLLWTDAAEAKGDNYAVELYGAVETFGDESGRSGWSQPVKITNFSEKTGNTVIDEFSAAMDGNGGFYLVSNMYTQNIDGDGNVIYSPNKMIEFTFDNSGRAAVEDIKMEGYPTAGETLEVTATLKNDGLLPLKYTKLTASSGETVLADAECGVTLLGGERQDIKLAIAVPPGLAENTPITVTAVTEDGQTAELSDTIPYGAELEIIGGRAVENENGQFSYNVRINNNGNAESGEFKLKIQRADGGAGLAGEITEETVPSIQAGESSELDVTLLSGTLNKNAFGLYGLANLKITAVCKDQEIGNCLEQVMAEQYVKELLINGNYKYLEVERGSTKALSLSGGYSGDGTGFTLTSSDESIFSVSEDSITGVSLGTAKLTAENKEMGVSAEFLVTVTEPAQNPESVVVPVTPKTEYSIAYKPDGTVVTAPEGGTYAVIFAAYDGNDVLTSMASVSQNFTAGENPPVSAPDTFKANDKVKVMLWKSLETMEPLCIADVK